MTIGGIDRLRYKESKTPSGNPYHECRVFRYAGLLSPITDTCFDSFSRIALDKTLEKCKINSGKYKALTYVVGIAADALIFYGIGRLIDNIVTKHRMNKADKLARAEM